MVLSEKTLKFPKNNKNHDSNTKKVVLICQKPIKNGSYFHVFSYTNSKKKIGSEPLTLTEFFLVLI